MIKAFASKSKFFFVYMIYSKQRNATYVGYTVNILNRLNAHNLNKGAKFTKGSNWVLIYSKKFKNKIFAMKYEYKLKKNRNLRKKILKKHLLSNN